LGWTTEKQMNGGVHDLSNQKTQRTIEDNNKLNQRVKINSRDTLTQMNVAIKKIALLATRSV
jgi:hypothetical protein